MSDTIAPTLVVHYNSDLDPLHPKNVEAAKKLNWEYDSDFHAYRDPHGFVMLNGESPQNNNVDCWR